MYDLINLSFDPSKCDLIAVPVFQIAWITKFVYAYSYIYIFFHSTSYLDTQFYVIDLSHHQILFISDCIQNGKDHAVSIVHQQD